MDIFPGQIYKLLEKNKQIKNFFQRKLRKQSVLYLILGFTQYNNLKQIGKIMVSIFTNFSCFCNLFKINYP